MCIQTRKIRGLRATVKNTVPRFGRGAFGYIGGFKGIERRLLRSFVGADQSVHTDNIGLRFLQKFPE